MIIKDMNKMIRQNYLMLLRLTGMVQKSLLQHFLLWTEQSIQLVIYYLGLKKVLKKQQFQEELQE